MSTENDVSKPHGLQQNIKMELMGMIHSAENPFDIICHIADYLEEVSAEDGYANHVRENLRAVYGLALGERKLLTDELADVIARLGHMDEVIICDAGFPIPLGVRTVDIGLPTFAMHSIRELCGSHDLAHLVKVLGAFYASRDLP